MVMRERRRRDRAARRRLLSCSSWSASASRYSCTNIGCMVAPLPRLVALLLGQSVSCGQKYVLLEQTLGRPGIHRIARCLAGAESPARSAHSWGLAAGRVRTAGYLGGSAAT